VRKNAISILLLSLLTVAAAALAGCTSNGTDAKENTVAATVNGKNIMLAEVESVLNQQYGGKQSQLSSLQLAQARLQGLEGLIQREVMFQRAEREKLIPTEDEISQYISTKKQGMTEEEFRRLLSDTQQTEQAFREDARKLLAIQKLQNKYTGNVSISDREVEDYYTANRQQFVIGRGVELADIVVDPRDNGMQDDAKSDAEAKLKIDTIYQNLKNADFAEVARAKSEDANSNVRGGDIGFATEDDLKQNGFPQAVIDQLFGPAMQVGNYTAPVEFMGRWYIFKLKRKQLTTENRLLETPGVRQEITEALRSQRQQLLGAALLSVALNEAKVVNNLAVNMLNNPNNLGLRPATPTAVPSPAASQQASGSPSPAASPAASPKASPSASK
jgi:parvulin-like peptidyl-prolyl isomerase